MNLETALRSSLQGTEEIMIEDRLAYIQNQFSAFPSTVYIGFSGGKDSSAVVKLLYTALQKNKVSSCKFVVVCCDTGVENPIIDRFVKTTLLLIKREAREDGLRFDCEIIKPKIDQSFFVRIIGRGYPPPTNNFRWCTKDIRIRPFQSFLKELNQERLIAVGTRVGESHQRDRSLRKSIDFDSDEKFYQRQREGFPGAILFTPIIDFNVEDVWETLVQLESPKSINIAELVRFYKDGSGECPTIRDFKDKPCSKARFGCWTCTVVRRDRSAERMILQGYNELEPYFRFRQWLLDIRNNPEYRCRYRRNGQLGPGPFNLRARMMILEKVNLLEIEIGCPVLSSHQRTRINELWERDSESADYTMLE